MKLRLRFSIFLLINSVISSIFSSYSYADDSLPPSADVSCTISVSGIACGNSLTIISNWSVGSDTSNPFLEWYFSLLRPGGDSRQISDYGTRVFQFRGPDGAVTMNKDFSYEELLKFANLNPNSTILVTAILFNGKGQARVQPGRQVSVSLEEVRVGMADAQALAQLESKNAESQSSTDLIAKAEENAKKKREFEAECTAILRHVNNILRSLSQIEKTTPRLQKDIELWRIKNKLPAEEYDSNVVCAEPNVSLIELSDFINSGTDFLNLINERKSVLDRDNSETSTQGQLGDSTALGLTDGTQGVLMTATKDVIKVEIPLKLKKTTIICVKGKMTKKVTGMNPRCPTGYKKK